MRSSRDVAFEVVRKAGRVWNKEWAAAQTAFEQAMDEVRKETADACADHVLKTGCLWPATTAEELRKLGEKR